MSIRQVAPAAVPLALATATLAVLVVAAANDLSLAAGPSQATPAVTPSEPAVTELPPTPDAPPATPEPPDQCRRGLPTYRFAWTLYVAPKVGEATGMWVPYRDSGGPYVKAYVKARYGDVWYGATLDPAEGYLVADASPAWPRTDIIRLGTSGVQTSRVGNPMCGRSADPTTPPCYAEVVVPLVFLDRLTTDGPYLRNTYFWAPSNQVVLSDDGQVASRLTASEYSPGTCNTARVGPRAPSARPVYAAFSGCSAASRRIDACYVVGCGDLWMHCQ